VVTVIWSYTGKSIPEMEQRVTTYNECAMSTSVGRIKNIEARSGHRDLYTGSGLFIATLDDPGPKSLPPPNGRNNKASPPTDPSIGGGRRALRAGQCEPSDAAPANTTLHVPNRPRAAPQKAPRPMTRVVCHLHEDAWPLQARPAMCEGRGRNEDRFSHAGHRRRLPAHGCHRFISISTPGRAAVPGRYRAGSAPSQ
jgi:hypothetical protein